MSVTVSVIIATYNMGHYLNAIIESTLNQSMTDFELIIVDDASQDDTQEVIKSFSDERIVVIRNKENCKSGKSRNIAIDIAKGKYIAICDADDINMPNRLEVQAKYLDDHPEVDVVGSNSYIFNDRGDIIGGLVIKNREHQDLVKYSVYKIPLFHPTIMGKTGWFKKFKYRPEFHRSQDFDLFLRSRLTSRFAHIPEYLYAYRDMGRIKLKKSLVSNWFKILIYWRHWKEYRLPSEAVLLLPMLFLARSLYYATHWCCGESMLWRRKKRLQVDENFKQSQRWINHCIESNKATNLINLAAWHRDKAASRAGAGR